MTRVHRVDRSDLASVGRAVVAFHRVLSECEHVFASHAKRAVDRPGSGLACGRLRFVPQVDVDGDDATPSFCERQRHSRSVSDTDFHEAIVLRESVDQCTAGG